MLLKRKEEEAKRREIRMEKKRGSEELCKETEEIKRM